MVQPLELSVYFPLNVNLIFPMSFLYMFIPNVYPKEVKTGMSIINPSKKIVDNPVLSLIPEKFQIDKALAQIIQSLRK